MIEMYLASKHSHIHLNWKKLNFEVVRVSSSVGMAMAMAIATPTDYQQSTWISKFYQGKFAMWERIGKIPKKPSHFISISFKLICVCVCCTAFESSLHHFFQFVIWFCLAHNLYLHSLNSSFGCFVFEFIFIFVWFFFSIFFSSLRWI